MSLTCPYLHDYHIVTITIRLREVGVKQPCHLMSSGCAKKQTNIHSGNTGTQAYNIHVPQQVQLYINEAPRCKTLCALCTALHHGIDAKHKNLHVQNQLYLIRYLHCWGGAVNIFVQRNATRVLTGTAGDHKQISPISGAANNAILSLQHNR